MSKALYLYSAPWCAPCKAIKAEIAALPEDIRSTITIYDAEQDAEHFAAAAVRNIPTLIIQVDGYETARITQAPAISAAVRSLSN